jgi:putative acetyltransferase
VSYSVGAQSNLEILQARSAAEFATARVMVEQYVAELKVDLCFQGLNEEFANFAVFYGPPCGAMLLARRDQQIIGCVGVRAFDPVACELKRLYVCVPARAIGAGRALTVAAIAEARKLGYSKMFLDTLDSMQAAHELYRSLGFRLSEPYYRNPLPGVRYMRLALN